YTSSGLAPVSWASDVLAAETSPAAPTVLATRLDGLDAHVESRLPSWDDLKDEGIQFMILRSTEDVVHNDDSNPGGGITVVPVAQRYRTRHDAARAAGIIV